jgi:hypothetical protein
MEIAEALLVTGRDLAVAALASNLPCDPTADSPGARSDDYAAIHVTKT